MVFAFIAMAVMFLYSPRNTPKPAPPEEKPDAVAADRPEAETKTEEQERRLEATNAEPSFVTLGSLDPADPYRMLVTLTNRGAAVNRIELSEERYHDVQDRSGYLGQIIVDHAALSFRAQKGCPVQVVGAGTPAARAGLQPGDLITTVGFFEGDKPGRTAAVASFEDFRAILLATKPNQNIRIYFTRDGQPRETDVTLAHAPIDIVRPETTPSTYEQYIALGGLRGYDADTCDPLSFLTTLYAVDDGKELGMPKTFGQKANRKQDLPRDETLADELPDVELRDGNWELVSADQDEAVFSKTIPRFNLRMRKIYRLAKVESLADAKSMASDAYHLTLAIELQNLGNRPRKVAYQLDGPTGAPLEGAWYSRKSGPGWGVYGIRDIVLHFPSASPHVTSNNEIAFDTTQEVWQNEMPKYIGVDSTYFQCSLLPDHQDGTEGWIAKLFPIRAGKTQYRWTVLTNNSFRLVSKQVELQPMSAEVADSATNAGTLRHEYTIFAGPKNPKILAHYGLENTLSYGWFSIIVKLLLVILHFFHSFGLGFGVAIILLTILVRLCMFRFSLKQAKNAAKMQQLQPEINELKKKYKDDPQAMMRAQQELWKKHKFHPASGCLGLLIQLPIFVALYKALSVDVELYGVPLFSSAIRWCSDLSAPDMLCYWGDFWNRIGWPGFNTGQGFFYLGPYFNLLPMLTVCLFLLQQQIMMPKPDPSDEQAVMQRRMMNWMMPMMGLLFFKMPSGLCIYFIVSTLWGLAERRFIPKPPPRPVDGEIIDTTFTSQKMEKKERAVVRDRNPEMPAKEEGFFKRMWREVNEKASERQTLEKAKKPKEKTRDRRKKK